MVMGTYPNISEEIPGGTEGSVGSVNVGTTSIAQVTDASTAEFSGKADFNKRKINFIFNKLMEMFEGYIEANKSRHKKTKSIKKLEES